jgi:integrase/recombinase XerD
VAFFATKLAIPFQVSGRRSASFGHGLKLYGAKGERKYLNEAERRRFIQAAEAAPSEVRLFCLTLLWSGARISEMLALTPAAFDLDSGVVTIETLKRRSEGVFRQVPLPSKLLRDLDRTFHLRTAQLDPLLSSRRIWTWSRTTAWRRVKGVMGQAGIAGLCAMPKGLRHSFGVSSFQTSVPPHLVQRWLGHASIDTTAIYGGVSGREEREFAARGWLKQSLLRTMVFRVRAWLS